MKYADDLDIYIGDAFSVIKELESDSIDCIVTSPPYWLQRDYGMPYEIGSELVRFHYVQNLVTVFHEAKRILKPTGTLWLNLGDVYRDKQLMFVPQHTVQAMQVHGWKVRAEIIWAKNNPMPESAKDRPTRAHEYVYMLTKTFDYYWDWDAASEPATWERWGAQTTKKINAKSRGSVMVANRTKKQIQEKFDTTRRNMRSVWKFPTQPYKGFHAAAFPEELPRRAIMASCPPGGIVLDPFAGSGTTMKVARELGRKAIGIDLQPDYLPLMLERNNICL